MAAGHTQDATLCEPGSSGPARPLPQVEADRYEVLGEVGEGGIGRVVRANDRRLNRTVAIKLLRRLSAEHEQRFFAEAELTARLEHPAIVPVHDVGRWHTGEPFYAMKLVTGDSLKEVVASCAGLDARLTLLPNVLTVCDAVAYAHSQGVIHRDLKPSNVMVGSFGETVVIDWGLARVVAEAPEARSVAGTPQYMAPEQARGEAVDRRSDVYALGALLYEVLGGRAPFEGESDVLGKVVREAPAPLPDDVPVELAAIVAKAMQKVPAARYADARELGADVRRYLEGQLVAAHRYSLVQRVVRLAARNKPLTAALVLLVVGAGYAFRRIVAERDVARAAEAMAETAQTHAEVRRNHLLLAQSRLWLEKDPTVAFAWLKSFAATDSAAPRDVSSIAADALARGVATQLVRGRKRVAVAPDSRTLAGVAGDELITWSVDDPTPRVLGKALGKVGVLRFVGPALYSGEGSTLRRWEGGVASSVFEAPEPIVAIAPAGEAVIAGGELGSVWLQRGATFEKVAQRPARIDRLQVEDGVLLVADSDDGFAVLRLDGGKQLTGGAGTGGWFLGGGRVSWGDSNGTVFVMELATGTRQSFTKEHDGVVMASVLAGPYLASAGQDHLLVVRDLEHGTKRVLEGSDGWLLNAAASPDTELLLTVGQDHVARVWHLASGVSWALRGHTAPFRTFAFTRDGARIVTADGEGEVRVWSTPRPRAVALLEAHSSQYEEARPLPDGRIITAGEDGKLNLWNPVSGERVSVDEPGSAGSVNVASGRVVNGGGGGAWLRSLTDLSAKPLLLEGVGEVHQSALSRDGALAAVACADHSVRVFDTATGQGKTVGTHAAAAWHVSFSPDSRWLASTGDDLPVRLWPLASGGEARALDGCEGVVFDLQFSPDGRWLAAAGIDPKVRVWSVPDFTLHTLAGHQGTVRQLAWSADGALLATASDDHTVRVWKPGAGEAPVLVLPHAAQVYTVVFSGDGRSLASGDSGGVWRWTVPGGVLLSVDREHRATLSGLWRSADGLSLVSAAEDHAVRFWPKFFEGGEQAVDLAAASSVQLVNDVATSLSP